MWSSDRTWPRVKTVTWRLALCGNPPSFPNLMIPLSNSLLGLSLFRKLTVGTFLSSHLAKRQSLSLSLELKIGKKRGGNADRQDRGGNSTPECAFAFCRIHVRECRLDCVFQLWPKCAIRVSTTDLVCSTSTCLHPSEAMFLTQSH